MKKHTTQNKNPESRNDGLHEDQREDQLDPSHRPYQPRGAARQLFYCRDLEVLIEGPAGTGKTRAVLEKIHLCASKYPGMRALLVRKTRQSMTQSVLVTFETHVLPEHSPMHEGQSRATRTSYHYTNGSEIVIGGIDIASRIMSSEYDMIGVFEGRELTQEDWESLLTRLRHGAMPYQQALIDTNPDAPSHWLNQRAIVDTMTRLRSRHQDNPRVTATYLSTLDQLSGARRLRLRQGLWSASQGAVYEQWDANVHVVNRFEIPKDWRRIRAIDFGFANPFVCQWWAIDPDGRLYLYREIYATRGLVEDHAKAIVKFSGDENIEATVADHDAGDRATLRRHGVQTIAAHKAIGQGIQLVQARLRKAGDGRPRLMLLRDSLVGIDPQLAEARLPDCTQQEFESYVWDTRRERELPIDANNHGLDALRYAVAYLDAQTQCVLGVHVTSPWGGSAVNV